MEETIETPIAKDSQGSSNPNTELSELAVSQAKEIESLKAKIKDQSQTISNLANAGFATKPSEEEPQLRPIKELVDELSTNSLLKPMDSLKAAQDIIDIDTQVRQNTYDKETDSCSSIFYGLNPSVDDKEAGDNARRLFTKCIEEADGNEKKFKDALKRELGY